jgi:hypothetical protein
MSTPPPIETPVPDVITPVTRTGERTRPAIVAILLVMGAAAVTTALLWHPGPQRDDFSYAGLRPVRDAMWTATLIDAMGYASATIALSIAVCLLAPARGSRWANIGAVLTSLGGIAFATGEFAYSALGWYATATDVLPVDTGTALMSYVEDHPAHMITPVIAGFLALNIGVLLLSTALWRSRSVPRWLPLATVVLTIGQFAGLPNRALDVEQSAVMVVYAAVAWYLIRATARLSRPSIGS